jgi:O-antigen/teichoic acid export membrane protein
MNSIIKKLANQTVYYGISSIVGRILNFFLVPLYVRVFTEGEYGVYTNIYAYFTFLNILYTYGMETAYFRFVSSEGDSRKVFTTATTALTVSTLIFSLMMFGWKGSLSSAMGYPGHTDYIVWILAILALDTLAVTPFATLRYRERPIKFASIKIISILANIFFNLFFLVFCPYILSKPYLQGIHPYIMTVYSPHTGIGYIFISNIIASAVTLLLLFKEFAEFNFDFDSSLLKRMLVYSIPLVVIGFAGMVNDNLDRTILKHLLPYSPEQNDILLGIYGANTKLAVFMVLVIQAFKYAAEPFFFLQAKKSGAKDIYADVMKYFVIMGLSIFLFVSLYIDLFKYFVGRGGSRYHEGLFIVPVLLLANLLLGVFYNLSIWYKLKDKTSLGAYVSVVGAGITIGFSFLLIPRFGYAAAAWTKLICYGTMVSLSYYLGQKVYPIAYPLKRMAIYTASALLLFVSHNFLSHHVFKDRLIVSLCTSTVFFAGFCFFVVVKEKIRLPFLKGKTV